MKVTDEKNLFYSTITWKDFKNIYESEINLLTKKIDYESQKSEPDIFLIADIISLRISKKIKLLKIILIITTKIDEYGNDII